MKRKIKNIIESIWGFLRTFVMRLLAIGIVFGVIGLFYLIGFKGIIGFLLGITIMSMVILSKNPVFMWLVEKAQADAYMQEITKDVGEEKNKQEKSKEGETIEAVGKSVS